MARRFDPSAVADRMAWGEEEAIYADELAPLVAPLIERLTSVEATAEVSTVTSEAMFSRRRPAAGVIDFHRIGGQQRC